LRARPRARTKAHAHLLALTAVIAVAIAAPASAAPVSADAGFAMPRTLPSGGAEAPAPIWSPNPPAVTQLSPDGRTAVPPASAPRVVKQVVYAANRITQASYRYGGGHRRFESRAYDCSGAVSFALHGGGLLQTPLDSRAFMRWGKAGPGAWITVYAHRRHAFVVIAGLRFDTSGIGERGPRWRLEARTSAGFKARHLRGL
jgi:cell wall-associated NlpC family hydrolase